MLQRNIFGTGISTLFTQEPDTATWDVFIELL